MKEDRGTEVTSLKIEKKKKERERLPGDPLDCDTEPTARGKTRLLIRKLRSCMHIWHTEKERGKKWKS